MRRKKIAAGILIVAVGLFLGWRLLLSVAMDSIATDDDEYIITDTGAKVVGALGDRSMVAPMIETLKKIRDVDGETAKALLRMNKRYPLNMEPYLTMLVNGALNEKNNKFGRIHLIRVLGAVTGNDFCFHENQSCIYEKELGAGAERVRSWWREQKKAAHR